MNEEGCNFHSWETADRFGTLFWRLISDTLLSKAKENRSHTDKNHLSPRHLWKSSLVVDLVFNKVILFHK
jgi:hypothetical protein